jgi:hypothetical protein
MYLIMCIPNFNFDASVNIYDILKGIPVVLHSKYYFQCLLVWSDKFLEYNFDTSFYYSNSILNIVTWRLKAGIVERIYMAIARQLLSKHAPAATHTHTATEEHLLKLQLLQNEVFHIFQRAHRFSICTRLSTFCIYDYITWLCRQQAEVMQNHKNDYLWHRSRQSQTQKI